LAEVLCLHAQVAIKVFRVKDANVADQATRATGNAAGALKQRFIDEARISRRLAVNPYIVEMYDFDERDDGTFY
jgi:serine/threonine protein kinase